MPGGTVLPRAPWVRAVFKLKLLSFSEGSGYLPAA